MEFWPKVLLGEVGALVLLLLVNEAVLCEVPILAW